MPIVLRYGNPDLGAIGASYLGLTLLGAALLSLGVFTSALTRNQVVAAVLGVGMGVTLWLLEALSPVLGKARQAIASLTPAGHYYDFIEGIIDTRALVYYLSFTFVCLFLASQVLQARRWRG